MYLIVDKLDLQSEFIDTIDYPDVEFEHFRPDVQDIIKLAGVAVLLEHDTNKHYRILAPVDQTWWDVVAIESGDKIVEHVSLERALATQRACAPMGIMTDIKGCKE